jgi:hypothetical protein
MNEIVEHVEKLVSNTELFLIQPHIQARNLLAKEVRDYLIRGLFNADRVKACIRDSNSYRAYFDCMTANLDTAGRKMKDLRRSKCI